MKLRFAIQSQIKCTKWENQKFSMSNCSKIQFGIEEPLSPFSITQFCLTPYTITTEHFDDIPL